MIKEILYNLKTFAMFKFIAFNIKTLGFWGWFIREFNNGWYYERKFVWKYFLSSMFNYFIGHPFLGFGISSIAVLVLGWESGYLLTLGIVIGVELYQMLFKMKAAVWYPIDAINDIATWMLGAYLFNLFNPMI